MYLVYICFELIFATNSHENIKPVVREKTQNFVRKSIKCSCEENSLQK